MAWFALILAGLFEIGWAVGLKYAEGFTRLWPSIWTVGSMAISVYLLAVAVRSLPLGTSYAVWTGIGTIGSMIYGIAFFSEPATFARVGCIALIFAGIAGLKFTASG